MWTHSSLCVNRQDANKTVSVPDSVKEMIISLRNFLQESCEPPVYVSDRRLLKSVAMLKVLPKIQTLCQIFSCILYSDQNNHHEEDCND